MFNESNVSVIDEIIGRIIYLKIKLSAVPIYYGTYRNYFNVIAHIIRKQYPIEGKLRDNNLHITLHNYLEAIYITALQSSKLEYDISTDILTIPLSPGAGLANL